MRASAGCGSTATTRAPSRRNDAMRSPTWAPTSNTRSSGANELAVEPVHLAAAGAVAVVDAQRAHDAAQRPPLVDEAHARGPAASSTRGQGERRHFPRRRGLLRQPSEPEPHHGAADRRRGGDDRERDRQRRPAGDEQRVGDRRRDGRGQQAERGYAEQGVRPELPRRQRPRHLMVVTRLRAPADRTAGQQSAEEYGVREPHDRLQHHEEKHPGDQARDETKTAAEPSPQRRAGQHVDRGRDLRGEPHDQHEAEHQQAGGWVDERRASGPAKAAAIEPNTSSPIQAGEPRNITSANTSW